MRRCYGEQFIIKIHSKLQVQIMQRTVNNEAVIYMIYSYRDACWETQHPAFFFFPGDDMAQFFFKMALDVISSMASALSSCG